MAFGSPRCAALHCCFPCDSPPCPCPDSLLCWAQKKSSTFFNPPLLHLSPRSQLLLHPVIHRTHLFQAAAPLNCVFSHSYSHCSGLSPQCLVINLHASVLNRTSYISSMAGLNFFFFYATLTLKSPACRLQGLVLARPPLPLPLSNR